jgi:integrase
VKQQIPAPAAKPKRAWLKTKYANLMRYIPSGCYYARFRSRGKLVWKTLDTDKVSIAQLRLADVLKEHHARTARQIENQGGTMTVGEALQTVLERIQGNPARKPLTKRSSADRIAALKRSWPGLEKLAVQTVTKTDCLNWVESATGDMSPSSFNQVVRHLRRAFALAVELGCRTDNPAAAIEWRREQPKELRLPEPEQFHQLVESVRRCGWVDAEESARFIEFLAYTGCRLTEAINVRWVDVDFRRSKIIVRGDPLTGTKNNRIREIPMIADAARLLETTRKERQGDSPETTVLQQRTARKALAHACQRLGISQLSHHDLRHLFATRCIESGVDIPTVSRWLGHKDGGALAMRVYGHLRDQHSQEMAKKVNFG